MGLDDATVRELDPPGDMTGSKVYPFEFSRVDLLYESYNGINVRLRYLLRVTVTRMYASTCTRDFPLWVRNTHTVPAINNSIKMEVRVPTRVPPPLILLPTCCSERGLLKLNQREWNSANRGVRTNLRASDTYARPQTQNQLARHRSPMQTKVEPRQTECTQALVMCWCEVPS